MTLQTTTSKHLRQHRIDWLLLLFLFIAAFLPRLYFAWVLDTATDEPIYTVTGQGYIFALRQLAFNSNYLTYNHEHPAFVKLLMGISIAIFKLVSDTNNTQLFAARMPSVIMGALLIPVIYIIGRQIIGNTLALLAALALLVSPYVLFYSAQALLDTTAVTLITSAFLVLWLALKQPRYYLLTGILVGLAVASKYPMVLTTGAMLLFLAYYYSLLNFTLPKAQRPAIPWQWWITAILLACLTFFISNPILWADPLHRLTASLQFSLSHAAEGHRTFWADAIYKKVPPWMILYVLWVKVSVFITLPAAFFVFYALCKICHFHIAHTSKASLSMPEQSRQFEQIKALAFIFTWLIGSLVLYSQLSILVGSHYYLPLVPPIIFAGVSGLAVLLNYPFVIKANAQLSIAILTLLLIGPHLWGVLTVYKLGGYTSEFVPGENHATQVAYNGYSDATEWLLAHTKKPATVGIVGGSATELWYINHPKHQDNLKFIVTTSGQKEYNYDYLIWPMHLKQRKLAIPQAWQGKIVHTITGGKTTYCFIMARDVATLKQ